MATRSAHTRTHGTPDVRVGRRAFLLGMLACGIPVHASAQGFGSAADAFGRQFGAQPIERPTQRPRPAPGAMGALRHWNAVALDATGLDHTPPAPGDSRVFGEQFGPGRASRAMAMVHIAVFDAIAAIAGGYETYTDLGRAHDDASVEAAIALAAHDTLQALFPSLKDALDATLVDDLAALRDGRPKTDGVDCGRAAAAAILARRTNDGSQHAEPRIGVDFFTSDEPGKWRQDPISLGPLALGSRWGAVTPFVLRSGDQLRMPPPPALESTEYGVAFDEAKAVGGDGVVTPSARTVEATDRKSVV